jgi:hypothetical protein
MRLPIYDKQTARLHRAHSISKPINVNTEPEIIEIIESMEATLAPLAPRFFWVRQPGTDNANYLEAYRMP